MIQLLATVVGLASLVCDILVIIKFFKANLIGLGILAILCPLFTFIYGWTKATEWNIKQIMMIWSALIAVNILLNVVVMSAAHG
jgi:hypothetical protein